MVRTDYRYGLNPVVVQAITNLHYRYSDETPKMWCSRIRVPFRKLIKYNPTFFSKNEYIHMTQRLYEDGKFGPGRRTFHIYCTVCDSLVFICDNTEECADKHLNECIAKIEERRIAYYRSILWKRKINRALSSEEEVKRVYYYIYFRYKKLYEYFDGHATYGVKEKIAHRFINSAIVIQRAWRAFKLGPETWAKRVWNMVKNDNIPDEKKYLGITPRGIRIPDDRYVNYFGQRILARDVPAHHQNEPRLRELYYHYTPHDWAEKKKYQLYIRLTTVAYIVTFIKSYQQDYRFVSYGDWTIMLKYLANPEHYRTTKYLNNDNVNFVRTSEYARYYCKTYGKSYSYDSLEIDMFKSCNITTFNGESTIIDFSDFNNNCEYVQRILRTIESI